MIVTTKVATVAGGALLAWWLLKPKKAGAAPLVRAPGAPAVLPNLWGSPTGNVGLGDGVGYQGNAGANDAYEASKQCMCSDMSDSVNSFPPYPCPCDELAAQQQEMSRRSPDAGVGGDIYRNRSGQMSLGELGGVSAMSDYGASTGDGAGYSGVL